MSDKTNNQSFGKWLREPQTMIGLSAIVLSICGLFISFYEASIIREHQRASVWPHVQVGYSFEGDNIGFHVSNTGIGPARIESANVTYKGNVTRDWPALVDSMNLGRNVEQETEGVTDFVSIINNHVLPPNTRYNDIFRLNFENKKKGNESIYRQFIKVKETIYKQFKEEIENKNINIEVCYCSVYDKCWVTTMIDKNKEELTPGSQQPIESCKDVEDSNI